MGAGDDDSPTSVGSANPRGWQSRRKPTKYFAISLDLSFGLPDISSVLTIDAAEKVRKSRDMTPEQFSIRLGYSARAYSEAVKRGRLSRWMAKEISQRFGVPLDGEKR